MAEQAWRVASSVTPVAPEADRVAASDVASGASGGVCGEAGGGTGGGVGGWACVYICVYIYMYIFIICNLINKKLFLCIFEKKKFNIFFLKRRILTTICFLAKSAMKIS